MDDKEIGNFALLKTDEVDHILVNLIPVGGLTIFLQQITLITQDDAS